MLASAQGSRKVHTNACVERKLTSYHRKCVQERCLSTVHVKKPMMRDDKLFRSILGNREFAFPTSCLFEMRFPRAQCATLRVALLPFKGYWILNIIKHYKNMVVRHCYVSDEKTGILSIISASCKEESL